MNKKTDKTKAPADTCQSGQGINVQELLTMYYDIGSKDMSIFHLDHTIEKLKRYLKPNNRGKLVENITHFLEGCEEILRANKEEQEALWKRVYEMLYKTQQQRDAVENDNKNDGIKGSALKNKALKL